MKNNKRTLIQNGQLALNYLVDLEIIQNSKADYFKDALDKTCRYIEAYYKYKNCQADNILRIYKYAGIFAIVGTIVAFIVSHFFSLDAGLEVSLFASGIIIAIFIVWAISLFCILLPLSLLNRFVKSEKLETFIEMGFIFTFVTSKEIRESEVVAMRLEKEVGAISLWGVESDVLQERLKKYYNELSVDRQKVFQEHGKTIAFIFDVTSAVIKNPSNRVFIEYSMGIIQI